VSDEARGGLARFLRWGRGGEGRGARDERGEPVATKAFGRFLNYLTAREAPVLLDLGPVVGGNVAFFGERLGCKLFVEDLFADLDRAASEGRAGSLAEVLRGRIARDDASVDGILVWDLFDHLDRAAASVLGEQLVRALRPGGVLLGFFASGTPAPGSAPTHLRYQVLDDKTLTQRPAPAARPRQPALTNRDLARVFGGLTVSESFLMRSQVREILFRKGPA
jgi:hypothetical protein